MNIQLFTWIFLIPLAVVVFGVDLVLVSGQCQSDQLSLLLRLNNSLVYDPSASTKLAKWNLTTDCCRWMGVACDQGGRVSSLDLSNESISGGFEDSSPLFGLQFLRSLNLSFNNFNTSLPASFANLTNLMYLNLSSAGFVGQIPIQISSLTRLVSLDLSMGNFGSSKNPSLKLENPNLAAMVQNLGHLTELVLDGVNISAKGNQWCQALSSSVLNLQVLSLSRCLLSGAIDPSLAKLQSLSVIRLSNNNFSASVPEFFVNFSKLSTLDLSFSNLTGNFPEGLFRIPTLEKLDLSDNKLLQGSFPNFLQNLSLTTLLLSGTSFSGTLPLSVGNLGKLSRMELAGCNFSGSIPNSVANLTQLLHLDLSYNTFTGPIPPLHMSKNLTYINFSNNELRGDISSTHWESLLNLVSVNLRNNSFTGNIPSSLLSIPSLQQVWLSTNQFEGKIPDFLNASSSLLDTLDLSVNKLEGSIPSSIFDLHKLSMFSLSFNMFNDSIELHKIWRLSNLTTLDLSHCNLSINASGSYSNFASPPSLRTLKLASCSLKVFPDLRKQSQLINLDLSDNQIGGMIPKWISEVGNGSLTSLNLASNLLVGLEQPLVLPSLRLLDLHNNELQGNIPPPPPFATYVDYSSNKFDSIIPINIGDSLPFAYFISLSNNSLTGVIPQSLCNATYLKVLDLSHNDLNGTILDCLIGGIESLGVINLRRNKFEGYVPDVFPSSCKLQTLDLSGNLLVGKVPKSLVNCTMLEVLDLGNNQMEDVFPCMLKNISTLRVLVLRSNKFYGGINCSQHYIWPRLQIVDLASNNFSGPLPSVCLETFKAMTGDRNETGGHLRFNPLQLTSLYYQDSITVTTKGIEMEIVKILTVYVSIDFSSNRFDGDIPESIGQFRAILCLNLSHNALRDRIPSSLGNLSQLESLDLSSNQLSGPIPQQLASLTFLGYLNISNNRLVGKIPLGTQIQSFSQASFEGNKGLCGPPLSTCNTLPPPPTKQNRKQGFDWQFIVPGLGFGAGAGAVVAPILSCKRVNKWYDDRIDKILLVLLPMLGYTYYTRNDWRNESDKDFTDRKDAQDDHEHKDPHEEEDGFTGRYCVFCTKVDITRKRVIHDLKCTCFHSPPMSSSSSFSLSSS